MATLSTADKWRKFRDMYTGGAFTTSGKNPYVRDESKWYNRLFGSGAGLYSDMLDGDYSQATELRNALEAQLSGDELSYWNSLTDKEKDALLEGYYSENEDGFYNLGGLAGKSSTFDVDSFLSDIGEYGDIEVAPLLEDYVNIDESLADAQASVDAENERLLASLNEDLQRSGDAFTQARDTMLTSQHQRNAQTMDTMSSDMSRARRNAIEAGASAGVRIASNVNALLSAQNKMSQQSLDTSNQLAQMLLNQRNAEAGLRNQWRDTQMSTYDRVQGRAQNEMNIGQQRYNQAQDSWQRRNDANVSESNALQDSMLKHKQRSAYSNRGSGSAY